MRRSLLLATLVFTMAGAVEPVEAPAFNTDPNSRELRELAKPQVVDESKYGCGPLLESGKTYYVSLRGNDQAGGLSVDTAWRHVHHAFDRLRAGDTLVIAEGEYIEPPLVLDAQKGQAGQPGRPITIMAAPRHRVVITAALRPKLQRTPSTSFAWETPMKLKRGEAMLWEADTEILLQKAAGIDMVEELPATWWYDEKTQKVHVHFSDSRAHTPRPLAVCLGRVSVSHFRSRNACAVEVRASYVRFKGLWFEHDNICMVVRGNRAQGEDGEKTYRGGDHVTIEDCAFSSTCFAGLVLYAGARWNLIKGNYGTLNGARGSLLVDSGDTHDNLFLGNRLDPSAPTVRTRGWRHHYGISAYGHVGKRNHVIGNTMNGTHSYRTKYTVRETVIQGNVMLGLCSTVPCVYAGQTPADLWEGPEDRIVFRNNLFLGRVRTSSEPMPSCGVGGNWAGPYKAFVNNFVAKEQNRAESIAAARFADPAYLDLRLQADSPLRDKALGGDDVGPHRQATGRILYVSVEGDDANPGTSDQRPFGSLAKAAASLGAGDTLYVMPGAYAETLTVASSGTEREPITIRAWGKKEASVPSIRVSGSWVVLEGFAVSSPDGDGILVTGSHVVLKRCLVHDCGGCGVKAADAPGLRLGHCTLVANDTGLALEHGSANATVRDSTLASNRETAMSISEDSRGGYLASHNCYFGAGLDRERIEREAGSVIADPKFVNVTQSDFRLRWDSPAAHLASFGRAAGARPALRRVPAIESIDVTGISRGSAVITWRTPKDDTTGVVRYRPTGTTKWSTRSHPELGTVHGVALAGLKPATRYELAIQAKSRRGGATSSDVQTFVTSDKPREPATYYVAPGGDDASDGNTRATAWRTIRKACFEAGPGDTVLVQPGTYREQFLPLRGGTREQRLTFRADGGEVVIDGAGVIGPFVKMQSKPRVTFDGFTFANAPREGGFAAYFDMHSSRGVEILNCRIGRDRPEGGFSTCFYLAGCPDSRIEGNVVWGTRYHVKCANSKNVIIKNNTFARGQVFSVHVYGPHDGVRVVSNAFYYPTSVPNAAVAIAHADKNITLTSDHNLFGPMRSGTHVAYVFRVPNTNLPIPGPTLAEWQKNSGRDLHSLQTDPLFVNPRAGDFRLRPGSPAIGAGLDGENIGALGVGR